LVFAERLSHLHAEAESKSLLAVLEEILTASGILKGLLSKEGEHENLARFRRLFDEAEQVVRNHRNWGLKEFLSYLDTLSEYRLPLSFRGAAPLREGVTLSTAHRAKGLEFERVYIVGAWDGHWGNRRSRTLFPLLPERKKDSEDSDSDERRLFYVALTRAKKESVISFSLESEEGKARLATRFISEIDPNLLSFIQGGKSDQVLKSTFVGEKKATGKKIPDKKFLQNLFLEEGLSVTALNNYLTCPWQYFFVNLLRIPKAPTYYQYYGIAVHAALQKLAVVAESGRPVDAKNAYTFFEESLKQQPLSGADLVLLLEKGKKAIPGYVKARKEKFNQRGLAEFRVNFKFFRIGNRTDCKKLCG
jgi:DNA helicase-2/ATP-dependent DNA helicase PcrA